MITRLEAVTVANGYATDVVTPVQKNVVPQETVVIPEGDAMVSIFAGTDGPVIQYASGDEVLLQMTVMVLAAIGTTQRGLVPMEIANNWIGDMRKLAYTLNASPTSLLAANVRSVELDAIEEPSLSDTDARIVTAFKILYWIDQVTP